MAKPFCLASADIASPNTMPDLGSLDSSRSLCLATAVYLLPRLPTSPQPTATDVPLSVSVCQGTQQKQVKLLRRQ